MKTVLLACAAMTLAGGANAATTFNFGTIADTASVTTGNLGQTATFTIGGLSVTASAFGPSLGGVADNVYGKNGGGNENGLGMSNDPSGDHEIYYNKGFLQLSFSSNVDPNAIFASFNSTTGGEQWAIYGSNIAGTIGSATLPTPKVVINAGGTTQGVNVQLTGGYKYYDIVSAAAPDDDGNGGNILLKNVTISAVPEPAAWGLMIVGFGGIGAVSRRRRAASVAIAA